MESNKTEVKKEAAKSNYSPKNYTQSLLENMSERETAIKFRLPDGMKIELTGSELKAQVASFADYLLYHEVGKGDIVAGICGNIPERIYAVLAAHSLGADWLQLSPHTAPKKLFATLQKYRPRVLVTVENPTDTDEFPAMINDSFTLIKGVKQIVVLPAAPPQPGAIKNGRYWNDTFCMTPQPLIFADIDDTQKIYQSPEKSFTHADFLTEIKSGRVPKELSFLGLASNRVLALDGRRKKKKKGFFGFFKSLFD